MKELIFPDTKQLHIEFLKNYGDEFLRINNLKLGDEIEIEFDYEQLRSGYKSRELNRTVWKKLAKGILKLDEDGCLYAESFEDFTFYWQEYIFGKYKWNSESRKSIRKFGTGFIYK